MGERFPVERLDFLLAGSGSHVGRAFQYGENEEVFFSNAEWVIFAILITFLRGIRLLYHSLRRGVVLPREERNARMSNASPSSTRQMNAKKGMANIDIGKLNGPPEDAVTSPVEMSATGNQVKPHAMRMLRNSRHLSAPSNQASAKAPATATY